MREKRTVAFFFTGLLCHLDDACTSNPCHEGAICDTSPINGSFTCSCATGYKGLDCSEDIDECEQGKNFIPLHAHIIALDNLHSYIVFRNCANFFPDSHNSFFPFFLNL